VLRRPLANLVGLTAICATLFVFQGHLLPLVARPLIHRDHWVTTEAIVISGGDRRFDYAVQVMACGHARRVLLLEDRERWVVKAGAVLPRHENAKQQLLARHVAADQIEILPGPTRTLWEESDRLKDWLAAHPNDRAIWLTGRFRSRESRQILDDVLSPVASHRVSVEGLLDRRYDETNWWKSRDGWKDLFHAYLGLGYVTFVGRSNHARDDWNPDAYEASIRTQVLGAGR
jgi:hypothetical protein